MKWTQWAGDAARYGRESLANGWEVAGAGAGYVTGMLGQLRLFGNTVHGTANQQFDEKHYLLIPDHGAESGYSLVVTRQLPAGVPPINDLPKRRVLHLPHEEAKSMLQELVVQQARDNTLQAGPNSSGLSQHLGQLVDQIDLLENKVVGGVLLIGGLVAIANPAIGTAIALKTILPSVALLASRFGLTVAKDSLNKSDLSKRVQQAEKDVLKQFKASETTQCINPLLQILERALQTSEDEFDPLLAWHEHRQTTETPSELQHRELATNAILEIYGPILKAPRQHSARNLGPEDVRFLSLLQELRTDNQQQ